MSGASSTIEDPPLGLIAGQGALPIDVAKGMRRTGRKVCCVGLAGQYDPELPGHCDHFRSVALFRIGAWIRTLRRWNVSEAVMIGRVSKRRMHDPFRLIRAVPDLRTAIVWYRRLRHDHRSPALLSAIADELARGGVQLLDSTEHIRELLAEEGCMTRASPTREQQGDIDFAWPLLKDALRLHIGQAIAVREKDVIAIEAVEGTDRMIQRAGELCRASGWTLLKSAPPNHDRRADVPAIGTQTVQNLHDAGGRCIGVGAGDVIIVEKEKTLRLADELGVAIVGLRSLS